MTGTVAKKGWEESIGGLKHLVGNTPLLEVRFRFRGRERKLYAKAEHANLTGSIKDRMGTFSSPASSPTRTTSRPTMRPRAPRSGGSFTSTA